MILALQFAPPQTGVEIGLGAAGEFFWGGGGRTSGGERNPAEASLPRVT